MTMLPPGLPPQRPPPQSPPLRGLPPQQTPARRSRKQPAPQPDPRPRRSLGITRIMVTSDLPAGVDALASADLSTVFVSAALDNKSRRAAVRAVLKATHRFPALVLYPALAEARLRRLFAELSESASVLIQHVTNLATASPEASIVASIVTVAGVAAATAGVLSVTGSGPNGPAGAKTTASAPAAAGHHRVVRIKIPAVPDSYLGVYADGVPRTYAPVESFAGTTGAQPDIALYYSGWREPFRMAFAEAAADHGAVPLVQIDPAGVSLAAIAAGRYDDYLNGFADAVADYGARTGQGVIIGFGHEPNASWSPWGWGQVSPRTWVAAWRHIVDVFRSQGADDVSWLWTINRLGSGSASASSYWPGPGYVTWVGIDGYYRYGGATFNSVFGPTINAVKQYGKPILLSETAAPPGPHQASQVRALFSHIRADKLLGFVWFDADNTELWQLTAGAAADAVFRSAARHLK
jgi:Glycosyl hydrolase family 26